MKLKNRHKILLNDSSPQAKAFFGLCSLDLRIGLGKAFDDYDSGELSRKKLLDGIMVYLYNAAHNAGQDKEPPK